MKLDILAIAAHPDDVELACGGTLYKHSLLGYKTGVLDLTMGQLGTRGSASIRLEEAKNAANILKLNVRENLGFEDGFFANDVRHQLKIIEVIRKYQPEIMLINAPEDRHPDHGRASKLASDAIFLSGLKKIETDFEGKAQSAWRPNQVYKYIQAQYIEPDFVVDISDVIDTKTNAILAYKSQFYNPNSKEEQTFISTPEFLEFIKARSIEMAEIAGVQYAEGFLCSRRPLVNNLFSIA